MGKIIGTWLVKLTLREQDEDPLESAPDLPTNDQVGELLADALVEAIVDAGGPALEANATLVERTDD